MEYLSFNQRSIKDLSFLSDIPDKDIGDVRGIVLVKDVVERDQTHLIRYVDRLIKNKIYSDNMFLTEDRLQGHVVSEIVDKYYNSLKGPIVFLDIDFVLFTRQSMMESHKIVKEQSKIQTPSHMELKRIQFSCFSQRSVRALAAIVKRTGAKVVISSVWRKSITDPLSWRRAFKQYFDIDIDVIGTTEECATSSFRGIQIENWLKQYPSVKNYVIIDDSSDFTDEQLDHLVHINEGSGLLMKHVPSVIRKLKGEL